MNDTPTKEHTMTDHPNTDEELLEALKSSPDFEEWAPSGAAPAEADEDFNINLDDALPEPEHVPAPDGNTATEAQLNFIKKLVEERAGDETAQELARDGRAQYARSEFSKASASGLIEALMNIPADWKRERANRPDAPEGMHKFGGVIFKVQIAVRGSGKPYAKALVEDGNGGWTFEYAAGAVRNLSEDTLLPLEEAKEFGRTFGVCVFCAKRLNDERSIDAGYGQTCAGKNGLPWG